jgi:hypothetical protein
MYLSLYFLVLFAIILYYIMILVSSLSSLTNAPHQFFTCMEYMIELMIYTSIVASLMGPTTRSTLHTWHLQVSSERHAFCI